MSDSPEPQLTERERAVLRFAVKHGPSTWRGVARSVGHSTEYVTPAVKRLRRLELLSMPPWSAPPYSGRKPVSRSIAATEAGRVALHTRAGFPPRSEWPLGALCIDGYYDGLGRQVFVLAGGE